MRPEIIERLKKNYQLFKAELTAYTQSGVSTTPYVSIQSDTKRVTWAEILLGITAPEKQKALAEFERTMTARYCFELLILAASDDPAIKKDAYLEFTKAQQDPKKIHRGDAVLSFEAFCAWSTFFNTQLNDPVYGITFRILLDYLVFYSDLAKTPHVMKEQTFR